MDYIKFDNRQMFRTWLAEHALQEEGIWIVFDKRKSAKSLKASEALEEALCFGWIDGQMQSIDDNVYVKYFKQRNQNSQWSEKNKALAMTLEQKGLMTGFGKAKIEQAKQAGLWDVQKRKSVTDEEKQLFDSMLMPYETAYANFKKMPKSMQNTYMASYFLGAKTDAGKQKRFASIVERLELNLDPMQSLSKAKASLEQK